MATVFCTDSMAQNRMDCLLGTDGPGRVPYPSSFAVFKLQAQVPLEKGMGADSLGALEAQPAEWHLGVDSSRCLVPTVSGTGQYPGPGQSGSTEVPMDHLLFCLPSPLPRGVLFSTLFDISVFAVDCV